MQLTLNLKYISQGMFEKCWAILFHNKVTYAINYIIVLCGYIYVFIRSSCTCHSQQNTYQMWYWKHLYNRAISDGATLVYRPDYNAQGRQHVISVRA